MFDFPTFSGGIEKEHWTKMGQKSSTRETYLAPVWNAQFESKWPPKIQHFPLFFLHRSTLKTALIYIGL